jgi:hypothetical protein
MKYIAFLLFTLLLLTNGKGIEWTYDNTVHTFSWRMGSGTR